MSFIKRLIYILKNFKSISNILENYDINKLEAIINYYKKEVNSMSELFKEVPYDYDMKMEYFKNQINPLIKQLKVHGGTKYYIQTQGFIRRKKKDIEKDYMTVLMAALFHSNPLYEIFTYEYNDNKKNEIIIYLNTALDCNIFVELINSISNPHILFEYEIVKNYSMNRLVFKIKINVEEDIYKSINIFIREINEKIYSHMKDKCDFISNELNKSLYDYLKTFEFIIYSLFFINTLEDVNEYIKNTHVNNVNFCKKLINLLSDKNITKEK